MDLGEGNPSERYVCPHTPGWLDLDTFYTTVSTVEKILAVETDHRKEAKGKCKTKKEKVHDTHEDVILA